MADALEPRRLLAAVSWDGGGATLEWSDPLNWSNDLLPGVADQVTIDLPAGSPEIRVSGLDARVGSLQTNGSIRVAEDGTFSGQYLVAVDIGALMTVDGTLRMEWDSSVLSGDVVINGMFDWRAGRIIAPGTVTIAADGFGQKISGNPNPPSSLIGTLEVAGRFEVNQVMQIGSTTPDQPSTIRILDGGVMDVVGAPITPTSLSVPRLIGAVSDHPNHQIIIESGGTLSSTRAATQTMSGVGSQAGPNVHLAAGGAIVVTGAGGLNLQRVYSDGGTLSTADTGRLVMDLVVAREGTTQVNGFSTATTPSASAGVSLVIQTLEIQTDAHTQIAGKAQLATSPFANTAVHGAGTLAFDGELFFRGNVLIPELFVPAGSRLVHATPASTSAVIESHVQLLGTFAVLGSFGGLVLPSAGSIEVLNGGVFDVRFTINSAADRSSYGLPFSPGVIQVHAGGLLSIPGIPGSVPITIAAPIHNAGVVRVESDSFTTFDDQPANLTGTWELNKGSIHFRQSPTELAGTVHANARQVLGLQHLERITGQLHVGEGRSLVIEPVSGRLSIRDNGTVTLAAGSTLNVTGDIALEGDGAPTIHSTFASDARFGRIVISDGALLLDESPDASPTLAVELAGGHDPAPGVQLPVIAASDGVLGAFDQFVGGSTPSGDTLVILRPDANTVAVGVTPGAAPAAPGIVAAFFENDAHQQVVVDFDQDVGVLLSRADFRVIHIESGLSLSPGVLAYDAATRRATLVFDGTLSDGHYRVEIIAAGIANAAGVPLGGGTSAVVFSSLAGDVNGDGVVGFDDLLVIAKRYGQTGQTFANGNIDYSADGLVGFADLLLVAQHYGQSLPALTTPLESSRKPALAAKRGDSLAIL